MGLLDFAGKWKDKITGYVDMRLQLVKLNIVEQVSKVLSYFIFTIACLVFLMPVLLFSGMGIAEYFASVLDSTAAGYGLTTAIYLLMLLILFLLRKKVINAFTSLFISVMTEDTDEDKPDTASE